MTSKSLKFDGVEFVTNNYTAIHRKDYVSKDFHLIQDYLSISPIGFDLTNPSTVSARVVLHIWRTVEYFDGDANRAPNISFMHDGKTLYITPKMVVETLHLPDVQAHVESYPDEVIRTFLMKIGYIGYLSRHGKLTRPNLHREWSFYFDYIGRAFTTKCTNFNAIIHTTQHVGYSLIHGYDYNFGYDY